MAEMQNTGNPIGSNDLKDLNDNLIVLDRQLNSEELTTADRFGNVIPTVAGMRKTMEDLASQIATNELVPIDGSRSADKLSLKDGENSLELKAESGELKVGDKTALVASTVDDVKTVDEPTNFTGALQQNGSGVITEATIDAKVNSNQEWLSMSAEKRIANVIYQNTTDQRIVVSCAQKNASAGGVSLSVSKDGINFVVVGHVSTDTYIPNVAVIPPDHYYRAGEWVTWSELRGDK